MDLIDLSDVLVTRLVFQGDLNNRQAAPAGFTAMAGDSSLELCSCLDTSGPFSIRSQYCLLTIQQ